MLLQCGLSLIILCAEHSSCVSGAVETLHDQLRDCVDLMGIGTGMPRTDTIAEEGVAVAKDQPKDLGDVRYVVVCYAQIAA